MTKNTKAVKFDRVSSKDQRDGFSLDAQKKLGDKYAKENKLQIVKAWSVDESASKEKDRKHFFAMLDFVKDQNIKDVIFDKVDRACRGLKSAVKIEELINEYGVRFHFVRDHLIIDSDSPPQEKLRFNLGIVLGKYYIDNLKSEINKGRNARTEQGLWNAKAPIGYKNIRVGSSNKAIVVPDEEMLPVIKDVFSFYATGNYSFETLASMIKERSTRKTCTKRTIEEMLANPFYYGYMRLRPKKPISYPEKTHLIKGAHEPIIDKEVWDKCQKIRGIRKANYRRVNTTEKPFMNWLTCGYCNHQITGEAKKKPSGRKYVYYRCANSKCSGGKRKYVSQDKLLVLITEAFLPFKKFTPKATEAFIKNVEDRLLDIDYYTQKKNNENAKKRVDLRQKILKLEKLKRDGQIEPDIFESVLNDLELKLAEVDLDIYAHHQADIKTFNEGRRIIELFYSAYNFMRLDGNELEKVRLAKEVLSNPVLKGETLEFHYQKPFDVLLPLTNLPVWWRRRDSNPRPNL